MTDRNVNEIFIIYTIFKVGLFCLAPFDGNQQLKDVTKQANRKHFKQILNILTQCDI